MGSTLLITTTVCACCYRMRWTVPSGIYLICAVGVWFPVVCSHQEAFMLGHGTILATEGNTFLSEKNALPEIPVQHDTHTSGCYVLPHWSHKHNVFLWLDQTRLQWSKENVSNYFRRQRTAALRFLWFHLDTGLVLENCCQIWLNARVRWYINHLSILLCHSTEAWVGAWITNVQWFMLAIGGQLPGRRGKFFFFWVLTIVFLFTGSWSQNPSRGPLLQKSLFNRFPPWFLSSFWTHGQNKISERSLPDAACCKCRWHDTLHWTCDQD